MTQAPKPSRLARESVVVRFSGDSGDGMQMAGAQFTRATAAAGNDLMTFTDFPSEIRAPAGSTFGVSSFQIRFGSTEVTTAGDTLDALVALNPAALKVGLPDLAPGGLVLLDAGSFTARDLTKAGYDTDPREDGTLALYRVLDPDLTARTVAAVTAAGLPKRLAGRARNLCALGLVLWLYGRDPGAVRDWVVTRFANDPEVRDANLAALEAGHLLGEVLELPTGLAPASVAAAPLPPGTYRTITGAEAISLGILAAAERAGIGLVFCGYPITPASAILQFFERLAGPDIAALQAEDEIAAAAAAIGASFAGRLGVTATSGPGMSLKAEALGLAVMAELPLVVVNAQRGGPSTGLPTRTEQSDLSQALDGRHGDAPLPVLAAATPADAFDAAYLATRVALERMTPVILLTDGYLQNASAPWRVPKLADLPAVTPARAPEVPAEAIPYAPYARDPDTLARPWAAPGMPAFIHRLGGLEKREGTGEVSHDPANHGLMTARRAEKVARVADLWPAVVPESGPGQGPLAIVGWGSTRGPIRAAVAQLAAEGHSVAHIHLRHIQPLPRDLAGRLAAFDRVLVAEMNTGQLVRHLRGVGVGSRSGGLDSLTKITGRPFRVDEIVSAARALLPIPEDAA